MKLLLYDMGTYTQTDIMMTLDEMGISYRNVMYKLKDVSEDKYFEKRICELIEWEGYDAIFSVNFFPVLARISEEYSLPYLSWTYDSPLNIRNMEQALEHTTTHAFFFDRAECNKYQKAGFKNTYHLPLAVNLRRLDKINILSKDQERYQAEISFVGQLYNTSLDALMMPMDDYTKGYLSAILETQFSLYGGYILKDTITDELMHQINLSYKEIGQNSVELSKDGLIATMAKHITHLERVLLLDELSQRYDVRLYGPGTHDELSKVKWMGSAGYFDEMPKIFRLSKINLNITLKCIQSGIPLRALDIMGCGGFLLSNWQQELAEDFVDGEDLVLYTSLEDAVEKCSYYLSHEEKRREIARNGYQKVKKLFRYKDRLEEMMGYISN